MKDLTTLIQDITQISPNTDSSITTPHKTTTVVLIIAGDISSKMNLDERRALSSSFPRTTLELFDAVALELERDEGYQKILPKEQEEHIRARIKGEGASGNELAHLKNYIDLVSSAVSQERQKYLANVGEVVLFRQRHPLRKGQAW